MAEDANHYPFHGKTLPGISFTVTDRNVLDSPEWESNCLARCIIFIRISAMAKAEHLIANADTMRALENQ